MRIPRWRSGNSRFSKTTGRLGDEAARLAATESGKTLAAAELKKQATANVAGRIGQMTALATTATGMEGGEIGGGLAEKIDDLNAAMAQQEGLPNAFQYSPSGDQGVIDAYQAVFGVDLVPIAPTSDLSAGFNGVQFHGTMFVDTTADRGFAQIACRPPQILWKLNGVSHDEDI